jgi:hypothetical protein
MGAVRPVALLMFAYMAVASTVKSLALVGISNCFSSVSRASESWM